MAVLDHGKYIMGPEIAEIEQRLAEYVGVKHAIGCSSGTDALLMALMAYNVGPGDAIFTTPFTFIATAEVISLLGATPVFVDIDPDTFNISPQELEKAITALKKNDPSIYPLPAISGDALKPKRYYSGGSLRIAGGLRQHQCHCKVTRIVCHRRRSPVIRRRIQRKKGLFPGGHCLHVLFSGQTIGLLRRWRHVFHG